MNCEKAVWTIKISSIVSLVACAVTLLGALLGGSLWWWKTVYYPALQVGYIAVALWCFRPDEHKIKTMLAVGLARAVIAGAAFVSSVRYFIGIHTGNVGKLLQFPAALLFLVGLSLYWMAERKADRAGKNERER